MSLSALLERVEGATGGDRALDSAIERACFGDAPITEGWGGTLDYTASVDAALALIGRVKPGMEFHLSTARHRKGWSVKTWVSDDKYSGRLLDAPTPALALCAALLAAMIGEEAEPSPPSTVTP